VQHCENQYGGSSKTKNRFTLCIHHTTQAYIQERVNQYMSKIPVFYVYYSSLHNSQTENGQSTQQLMNEENIYTHTYHGILLSHKEK
jgi:hypothetical protein